MKKFPILMVLIASFAIWLIGVLSGSPSVLSALSEFGFTVFSFLALIAVFNDLNMGEASLIGKSLKKIKTFLTEEEVYFGFKTGEFFKKLKNRILKENSENAPNADAAETAVETAGNFEDKAAGLIEIQKEARYKGVTERKKSKTLASAMYVTLFTVFALWRITRSFTLFQNGYETALGIPAALLLLFIYFIIIIYLKMKNNKTNSRPADSASYGMLILLAYVTLIHAAVIGINAILNIDILGVLRWVFYAGTLYVITAMAVNILIGLFKGDAIGNFDYKFLPAFIPGSLKANTAAGRVLDSENAKARFSLKSLYTIKYTLRIIPGIILSLGFVLLLSTTMFVVQPHQQAAVFRLGRLERSSILEEGFHFKLPWPIDIVSIYDVHRISSLQIGREEQMDFFDDFINWGAFDFFPFGFDEPAGEPLRNFLWTEGFGNQFLLLLGNGNEMVSVNIQILYRISDLYSYIKTSANPRMELSAAAYRALMNRTANTTLDAFLNVDRSELSASILHELASFSCKINLGISVLQVNIENINPPFEVADVYQRVATAFIDKNTIITNARARAEEKIINSQQTSTEAVEHARAQQLNRVSAAQRDMAVFYAAMDAYAINPRSFRLNNYLSTFERVIEGTRVYVFFPGTEDNISRAFVGQRNVLMPGINEF